MAHDDLVAERRNGPILLCAGNDPGAAARLAEAALSLLADRPAVVVSIWQPPPAGGIETLRDALYDDLADVRAAARHAAANAAGAACEVLDAHGLDVTRRVRGEDRSPWRAILDIADEIDAAVIVAGTSEDSEARSGTLGREARGLAHRSRQPLLLLAPGSPPADAGARALFAYDGSAPADHALRTATQLLRPRPALAACAWQSAAYAVSAAILALPDEVARKGVDELDDASRHAAESHARDAATQLGAAGWSAEAAAVRSARSSAGAIIVAAEDHDAAVIVTGTRGRSRLAAALLGSTAEAFVRHAGRPVLLVPPPQPAA